MKNFKSVSDAEILQNTFDLASRERAITLEILHHLIEISGRRLFAARGFGSLFDYLVHELRYSESAAQRRIDAMKTLRSNPEIEEKIEDGTLKLCVVAQAQKFFRHEAKANAPVDRAEVLKALENKSAREAERELLARSSNSATLQAERITAKTEELSELRMLVRQDFLTDMERLKGLLAHRDSQMSHAEVLGEALRTALAQLDPAREPKRRKKAASASEADAARSAEDGPTSVTASKNEEPVTTNQRASSPLPTSAMKPARKISRHIPAATKREVWRRAQGRCEYAGCESCFGLEIDHIVPISRGSARGGTHELSNLRLLCFQHNQYEAERILGREFMEGKRAAAAC